MVFLADFGAVVTKDEHLNTPVFTSILIAIIFGWLLVSVYQRVLENFVYEMLGFNSRSTLHALIVAVVTTIFFVSGVWMLNEYKIVPEPSEDPFCDDSDDECDQNDEYEKLYKLY